MQRETGGGLGLSSAFGNVTWWVWGLFFCGCTDCTCYSIFEAYFLESTFTELEFEGCTYEPLFNSFLIPEFSTARRNSDSTGLDSDIYCYQYNKSPRGREQSTPFQTSSIGLPATSTCLNLGGQ